MSFSRRKARVFLLQALYADIFLKNENIQNILDSYQDELSVENMDAEFFAEMRGLIHKYSQNLLFIILTLAPKFPLEKIPKIHVIILMIAFAEINFWKKESIDVNIIINEAVELAKMFSDISGAKFVNGVLGTYIRQKDSMDITTESSVSFFF